MHAFTFDLFLSSVYSSLLVTSSPLQSPIRQPPSSPFLVSLPTCVCSYSVLYLYFNLYFFTFIYFLHSQPSFPNFLIPCIQFVFGPAHTYEKKKKTAEFLTAHATKEITTTIHPLSYLSSFQIPPIKICLSIYGRRRFVPVRF